VAAVLLLAVALALAPWRSAEPLPEARTEIAGGAVGSEIVVLGGLTEDGAPSARVDAYSPARDTWRRLADLPAPVHHPMAASDGTRLYVAGGYGGGFRDFQRSVYVLERGSWRALPRLPAPRAAGGAAVVAGKLYVVGGVGPGGLAREGFVLDLATRRWSTIPGPTPREHLAVATSGGRIYALAGRTGGINTNLRTFEVYTPSTRTWRKLPSIPGSRGGTGAAFVGRLLVSVGGEEPAGTIESVYGYDSARGSWSQLPDLQTSRHGLAVVALQGRVYAIGGGPQPGLTVSDANEWLLPR
jgi:N-acetylneuraminic acid mutarotase